jgi:hypothetical protein
MAYGRLVEPNWWFLMTFPSSDIVWSSLKTASWVLLFGFIGVALQAPLLYRLASRDGGRAAGGAGRGPADRAILPVAEPIEARPDEIGSWPAP